MTNAYSWVQWNRHKKVYDAVVVVGVVLGIGAFVGVGVALNPTPNNVVEPILLMRAIGTMAIVLLHVILLIGPLSRLSPRLMPLLYNRRHLGVVFFLLALMHAALATLFYGAFGIRDPLSAVLAGYDSYASITGFPFELLGLLALLVFFVMAATSHDFWLKNLGPRTWKTLHMLVYVAYALLVAHVALGAMQAERSLAYPVLLGVGVVLVGGAHLFAGWRELGRAERAKAAQGSWVDVGPVGDIAPDRAKIVELASGERIAVFRHGDRLTAMTNACAHQGGPLGEGQVIDGCVTCPWHGYQYRAEDGCSPPPYTEKVATYELRVSGDRVLLDASSGVAGVRREPVSVPTRTEGGDG